MNVNILMFTMYFGFVASQGHGVHRYLGIRGKEFIGNPLYPQLKKSRSTCSSEQFVGFYADLETGCQTYHTCYRGSQNTFHCPSGTLFNQLLMTCDFWYKVRCKNNNADRPFSTPHVTTSSTTEKTTHEGPEEPEWTYAWHRMNPKTDTARQGDRSKISVTNHIERENNDGNTSQEKQKDEAPNPWLFPGGFIETFSNQKHQF